MRRLPYENKVITGGYAKGFVESKPDTMDTATT
jgi:hypothetical protein